MKILVPGGTGFVGTSAVTLPRDTGHDVTVFHSGPHEADLPIAVNHIHGNRQQSPGLGHQVLGFADEFRRVGPEVVLYMLPIGDQDARAAVIAFRRMARRLVAISSMDVCRAYGRFQGKEPDPPDPVPLKEYAPLRSESPSPSRRPAGSLGISKLGPDRRRLLDRPAGLGHS